MAKTGDSCSFCGRSRKDVNLLIGGITGAICDECAGQAYNIVQEHKSSERSSLELKYEDLPRPEDI